MTEKKLRTLTGSESKEGFFETQIIVPDKSYTDIAEWVANEITMSGSMLPKSTDDILEMFDCSRSVVLVDGSGKPVAHAGITFVYSDEKVVEVGGVVVDRSHRKKGLGKEIVQASIDLANLQYPGWKKIALCNEQSLPIYLSLGSTVMEIDDINIIPKEAWEACLSCPNYIETKKKGKICCDTLVLVP